MKLVNRLLTLLFVLVLLPACTTLEHVEMPAAELQRRILSGELPLEGEFIKVATADGKSHRYRVTEVDRDKRVLLGGEDIVPIDDILAIETREFSLGKTALLAGSSYVLLGLIALAAAPAFLL